MKTETLREYLKRICRGAMTPTTFTCFWLFMFEDKSQKEIGIMMDLSQTSVSRHVLRGKKHFARILDKVRAETGD